MEGNKRSSLTVQVYTVVTLHVDFYANFNGNVTLPPKRNPCGAVGGSPSATALRPDPVDLISNPFECFENLCTEQQRCEDQQGTVDTRIMAPVKVPWCYERRGSLWSKLRQNLFDRNLSTWAMPAFPNLVSITLVWTDPAAHMIRV